MSNLLSYKLWKIDEENLHSGDALKTYNTGIDDDINLASEAENQLYAAYLDRMEVRLEKHKESYEQHLEGRTPTEAFVHDIALTRRLFEDWDAYAQRLEKLVQVAGKKKEAGGR